MLGITGRRILLSIHLLLNSLLVGGIITIFYLIQTSGATSRGDELYGTQRMIFMIHDMLVMNAGLGVVITGLLFSLFTRWGFFDFPWVIVKWSGIIIIFLGITFFLAPAINGMAAIADVERSHGAAHASYGRYESQAITTILLLIPVLITLVVVSVFKPWGQRKRPFRVRRRTVLLAGILLGCAVVGSTVFQFLTLQHYRSIPIGEVDLSKLADGVYTGEATLAYNQSVAVHVTNHHIDRIDILRNDNSVYAKLAEGVTWKVLKAQSPAVSGVTGATTSSVSLLKAIENALSNEEKTTRPY
jgi:uncharacterized protein with FMN-binding domain